MGLLTYFRIKARAALYGLLGDQRGLETIEIVLIAALVIVGSITLWRFLGVGVKARLWDLCDGVDKGKCGTKP